MKRGAEKQITREGEEVEDEEEVSGDAAFHKADDAVLATRKLAGASTFSGSPSKPEANGAEAPATPPLSKFNTFSGFGTPGSSGTGFSFVSPSASPSFPTASTTPNIFGSTPGTPTPSTLFSTSLAPAVAPTASNAAKTLSSFLGGSPSKPAASSAPSPSEQTKLSSSAPDADSADEAELKYYRSLRGLNVSILAAITSAIEADPFTDIASLLDRYNSLRVDVQKEYDGRVKSDPPRSSAPSPSPFAASIPTPQPPSVPAAPLKMPAPPVAFAGFGKPAAAPAPKTNGAVDAPPANPPAPPANPFTFAVSAPTSTSVSTAPKPSLFGSSATPSAFGAAAPPTSLFGSSTTASPFGAPAATTPSPFGSPTSFGGGAKPAASLFGSGTGSPSPSPFGGFGSKGSIGNPEKEASASAEEKQDEEGDTVGASSQETEKASTVDEGSTASGSSSSLMFNDDVPTGLEGEGEGEEDEETVQQARVKAYRLRKKEEPETGWADIGSGLTRLKKHKETSARRLLLRNSAGKIGLNFALYSGLKASQAKKALTLVGHDAAGESQTYSLRFRSEDAAKTFQAAIDKEVAQIKPS
ncbi:RanBD1 domain-containing protein [Mycena sanguinolenta]|uniref:RanBD1 domain-containing protein n=1 Tax=Mycena sanguinolenta TaxID=230812 RepID=A0A8H6ZFE2_9AGAR|nr:RanBD1 domain-containing protein [Mycena sanguinolenta]